MLSPSIKADFPILQRSVNGKPLVYLDSAATSQKPRQVIEAMSRFYEQTNSNVHRGIHTLSAEATKQYEDARRKVAKFINAAPEEIIFTRNATEAINLVKLSWAAANIKEGDTIIATALEHHSNLVPWQMLAKEKNAKLLIAQITKDGVLDRKQFSKLLATGYKVSTPKLVCMTHVSNVLGTVNSVHELAKEAHAAGAVVLLDAAQSVPHLPVDVKSLDCDFLAFSSHKMLGPTGIGVLYAKKALLESMEPVFGGGDMIKTVSYESATWNDLPWKFEAGTPAIAEAVGLGAAVDYLQSIGMDNVAKHEQELTAYALDKAKTVNGLTVYGPQNPDLRTGVFTFNLADIHSHDVTSVLDSQGIAVRSGHHCAQPLVESFGVPTMCRASFSVYTTKEDIDALFTGLEHCRKVFRL